VIESVRPRAVSVITPMSLMNRSMSKKPEIGAHSLVRRFITSITDARTRSRPRHDSAGDR
jgi:hypothetical protein